MPKLTIGQRILFKPTAWGNQTFSDVVVQIKDQFAITEQNQVIDMETNQWIQPNGYRTFSPGKYYITEEDMETAI